MNRPREGVRKSKFAIATTYLFQRFCKVIQCIHDTIVVYDLVGIDTVVATASSQNAIDEFSLTGTGRSRKRFQEVLCGGLKGSGRVHDRIYEGEGRSAQRKVAVY